MVLAHDLIENFDARCLQLLLDLLMGEVEGVAEQDLLALREFARRVTHELGEDHPASVQLREVLEAAVTLSCVEIEASPAR